MSELVIKTKTGGLQPWIGPEPLQWMVPSAPIKCAQLAASLAAPPPLPHRPPTHLGLVLEGPQGASAPHGVRLLLQLLRQVGAVLGGGGRVEARLTIASNQEPERLGNMRVQRGALRDPQPIA